MKPMARHALAIAAAGLWINASEFFRNELLLKSYWLSHYQSLGMNFPSGPVNGLLWVLWGFVLAAVVHVVCRRFGLWESIMICWAAGFVLMWIVIRNLNVLPDGLLLYALPLSLLEVAVAALISRRIAPA